MSMIRWIYNYNLWPKRILWAKWRILKILPYQYEEESQNWQFQITIMTALSLKSQSPFVHLRTVSLQYVLILIFLFNMLYSYMWYKSFFRKKEESHFCFQGFHKYARSLGRYVHWVWAIGAPKHYKIGIIIRKMRMIPLQCSRSRWWMRIRALSGSAYIITQRL